MTKKDSKYYYPYNEIAIKVNSVDDIITIFNFIVTIVGKHNFITDGESFAKYNHFQLAHYPNYIFIPLPITPSIFNQICILTLEEPSVESIETHILNKNDGKYILSNELTTLKKLILNKTKTPNVNYNEPKKLVYETKNNIETHISIILKINTINEFNEVSKFAFDNGYEWYGGDNINEYNCLIFFPHSKLILKVGDITSTPESIVNSLFSGDFETNIPVHNINELKKAMGIKIDYNKPRNLVYESIQPNDYTRLIYKCNSQEDLDKVEKLALESGYKWDEDDHYNPNQFILFYPQDKTLLTVGGWSFTPEKLINFLFNDDFDKNLPINSIKELKKIIGIKIDYNKPRNLVYENLKNDNIIRVVYKCNDQDELDKLQKIAFDNGYLWIGDDKQIYYQFGDVCIVFYLDSKTLTCASSTSPESVIRYSFDDDFIHNLPVNNIKDLRKIIGIKIDYNTPKKLVYEGTQYTNVKRFIYKSNDKEESNKVQEIAFNNGYTWSGFNEQKFYDLGETCIIFNTETKTLLSYGNESNDPTELINDYFSGDFDENCPIFNLTDLKIKLRNKIDYNIPKKLVYENIQIKKHRDF